MAHDHSHHGNHGASSDLQNGSVGGDDMCMDEMMMMYFHGGHCEKYVLFDGWEIKNVGGLAGSVIGVFFLAVIYEGLKYFREYLFKRANATVSYRSVNGNPDAPKVATIKQSMWKRILSVSHFTQTGLHVVQVTLSYFLMLIFMTYNIWLCLGVILGAGVGFFIFGWKKTIVVDITEHCH